MSDLVIVGLAFVLPPLVAGAIVGWIELIKQITKF